MTNPASLLIVIGAVGILMLIQYRINRFQVRQALSQSKKQPKGSSTPSTVESSTLIPGLSATGLDSRGIKHLQECLHQGDIDATTVFLAFNQCSIPEIDAYLYKIHQNLMANRPRNSGSINKITLLTLYDHALLPESSIGIQFKSLNEEERLNILGYKPSSHRIISRDLLARFGGHHFAEHFSEYQRHKKPCILCISTDDPRRPIFEKLSESGVAEQGRDISLQLRLSLLNMAQLQQMAKDLNLKLQFQSKHEAISTLANINGSRVLFSMQFVVDDLFHLMPIPENEENIQKEWGYLSAYAKLLHTALGKNTKTQND